MTHIVVLFNEYFNVRGQHVVRHCRSKININRGKLELKLGCLKKVKSVRFGLSTESSRFQQLIGIKLRVQRLDTHFAPLGCQEYEDCSLYQGSKVKYQVMGSCTLNCTLVSCYTEWNHTVPQTLGTQGPWDWAWQGCHSWDPQGWPDWHRSEEWLKLSLTLSSKDHLNFMK